MDLSRGVFIGTSITVILAIFFFAGLYSGYTKNPAFQMIREVKNRIEISFEEVKETPLISPKAFLQPVRKQGEGVTINTKPDDDSLIFLTGFFEDNNELRLIRRDGSIIKRWPVRFSEIFPDPSHLVKPPATDWNVDLHGAIIQPDGSVVFNFEYNGLVKLNRCGEIVWKLGHQTHHSVEQAEDGTFWVAGQKRVTTGESPFKPFTPPYREDLILNVSEDGEIILEISVPALLYENGLEAILTATGETFENANFRWDRELVHVNKVAVLDSQMAPSFPNFEAGDLLVSLRNLNLLIVVNPDTRKIKWWQIGPWLRQHDPEFNKDGTLTVFNNNTYKIGLGKGNRSDPNAPRTTNIMRVNPETRETQVVYGERPGQELLTFIRGKHEVTEGGGFLITEFEAGRVIETDASGNVIWEYINRYDSENVAELTEARLYAPDYFTVTDWSCASQN